MIWHRSFKKYVTWLYWIIMGKYEEALRYEIFIKKEYEKYIPSLSSEKIVFDIGWHWWFFSEWCFEKGFSWEIYFFEPILYNYQKAKENLKKYEKHIHFFNVWIWLKKEKKEIFFNEEKTMQSSEFWETFLCKWWKTEICDFESLNDLVSTVDSIDIMKMDIEWAEFEVLLNTSEETFKKIKILVLEYHEITPSMNKNNLINTLSRYFSKIEENPSIYTKNVWYICCIK